MRKKIYKKGKRCLAAGLSLALFLQSVGSFSGCTVQAKESVRYTYLPVATMPEEIESADTFYVGTTSADLNENAKNPYLLKIGRGGNALGAASVTLKISDATASYGKDYKIRLHSDKKTEADSPEDNQSLLDMVTENDILEDLQLSEEEQAAAEQENLESLTQAAEENAEELTGGKSESDAASQSAGENKEDTDKKAKEGRNINNPLAQAKEMLTGITSDRETVTSTKQSMVDVLSESGNYLTQMVPGATLTVDFEPDEKSKYVEIIPLDNGESDGSRIFYVTLSEPSEGMTNSSVSESMFTIKDDEPQEDATVSFVKKEFTADAGSGSVEVVLKRSGAMTQMVSVHMTSKSGTAVSGQDFAPVDADVLFPFGITERKLKITVDSQYLKKDADFTLCISSGNGAVAGETSQTKVVIKADASGSGKGAKVKEKTDAAVDEEVSAQASLSDKKYGREIDLTKAAWKVRSKGGDTKCETYYDGSGNSVLTMAAGEDAWLDVAVALSGQWRIASTLRVGKAGRRRGKIKHNEPTQYVYDGFRFEWKKTSKKACWSYSDVAYYRQGETSNARVFIDTGDRPRFGWETLEYRFGAADAANIKFYNWGRRVSGIWHWSTLYVQHVTPILRPFKVELAPADKLTYYTGSGNDKAENADAVSSTLLDSVNGYAVKYDGDKMAIKADNATLGISRLSGVEIVSTKSGKSGSVKIDKSFLNGFKKGDGTLQVTLNNEFCTKYKDYIGYEGNGDSSIRGKIKLKPVYEYIDSQITVEKNTEKTASGGTVDCKVKINGTEVSYGKTQKYHMGDKLVVSSSVTGSDYTTTGVELSFQNNSTGRKERNQCFYNNGRYVMVVCREKYTALPMFTENNNRIAIQVSEADVSHFKESGIFDAAYLKEHGTKSNGYYTIEVVSAAEIKEKIETSYTLAAEAKDGYIPIWQETNSIKYFMGTTFDYVAKPRRTANIVFLYAARASSEYAAVKGTIYYENLALNNPSAAGEAILPAQGGYLSVAGQYAIADMGGAVLTNAFALPGTITKAGKSITLSQVYVRALAGAAGNKEHKDIALKNSGSTQQVEDAAGTVRTAYLTQMSTLTISCNTGENTRFNGVYIKNKNFPTDTAYMNDEVTSISATVTELEGEKVKAVEFLVYDRHTNEIKHTIKATKSGSTWTGKYTFKSDGSEDTLYAEGDRIYVQMTTDKKAVVLNQNNVDDKGKPITSDNELTSEAKAALNQTVYAPANTGYTLVKSGLYEEPTAQALDIGSLKGLSGIPMLNNFNTNLNLGPLTLSVDNLYDDQQKVCGQRLKVAIGVDIAKLPGHSKNYSVKDDGINYGGALKILGNLKDSYKEAFNNVLGVKDRGKTKLASMGASKWGIYPSVGLYLDFAIAQNKDINGEIINSRFVLQGGGVYLGATGNFSVAWYALIPVVYIPCYFGVAGKLSLALQAGGATAVENTEEKQELDDFLVTSHNLSETLEWDFQFSAAGQIQVYCGVGICGTLGVRGGMEIGSKFLWYPTLHNRYSYFDQIGVHADVGFKMWVDLLVFTIPIPVFKIVDKDFGLLEQYEKLKDKNEDELDTIIGKNQKAGSKKALHSQASSEGETEITYLLKERDNNPEWSGKMKETAADGVVTMATYKEKNTHTILADGYDRPDSQMIDMGDNGTLLVFLQDDKSRTDAERTAVSYSVYKDGSYSDPVIIQTDKTADYQPSVTDAGDNVIITWVSSDPAKDKGDVSAGGYQSRYLKSQEVYVTSIPKADLAAHKAVTQENIIKLTNDEYYDSNPVAVYDEKSKDYNVYYVKTAEDNDVTNTEATDLANPMNTSGKTYSVIAYRVYDASADSNKGKWLVDEYAEKEKPDNVTDADYKAQLTTLGGQRMLSSPITAEDVNMEDPLISDFTAIGYNGIAVFAYTIDKDNSADTDTDRDLFLQVYDFNTRSTYKPIRITDDELADSMPQLIRRGGDSEGTTYLFWRSDDTLGYIDISSLVKYGIDDNGNIIPSVLEESTNTGDGSEGSDELSSEEQNMTEEEANKAAYKFHIYKVDTYGEDENKFSSYSQYKVAVDADDNLYVIWVDNGNAVGGKDGATVSQEIFAAAMIESEVAGSTEGEDTIKSWSEPNRLTSFGKYCDEPALAITKEGKMLMAYNKYDITEDKAGNPSLADLELASSMLEPYGSVEAAGISLSDTTPVIGEKVEISVIFKNTGLTVAKDGFTAKIYEKAADGTKTLLETYNHEAGLIATEAVSETFFYTANEKTDGSIIEVSVTENNLKGTNVNSSEPFMKKAEYEIVQNNAYEGPDSKFYSEVTVTNTGNMSSSSGDELMVEFAGPYGNAAAYGLTDSVLAKQAVSLEAGESETVMMELDIPAKAFDYYGKIDTEAKVVGKNDETESDTLVDTLYMSQPAELVLNDNKDVEMKEGDTLDLRFQYETCSQLKSITPTYMSDDESVVRIEDGKLAAVGEGTTVVSAYAYPYHAATAITITVKGAANPDGTETPGATETPRVMEPPSATEEAGAAVLLAKAKIKRMVSNSKKKLTVSWNKVKGASGYQITYATNKSFTKNKVTKKTTKTSLTLKNLNKKKTYYVKVRAYTRQGTKKVIGRYSTVKKIKLSPRPAKVNKVSVKSGKKKLTVSVSSVKYATGYEIALFTDKKGKKAISKKRSKKGRVAFKKRKKKTKYYVTVRAYKKTGNGGYLYGTKKVIRIKNKKGR